MLHIYYNAGNTQIISIKVVAIHAKTRLAPIYFLVMSLP